MTMPLRRRVSACIAAMALVVGLTSGCTAGDWRYDAPPAAGVQTDAGPVKVRNLMVLADADGDGLLLGSVFTSQPVELEVMGLAVEQSDGSFTDPVVLELAGDVPVQGGLMFGGPESRLEGVGLTEGLLARVIMQFSDGTSVDIEAPVMSSEHPDYKSAWDSTGS